MIKSAWVLSALLLLPNILWVVWRGPEAATAHLRLPRWTTLIQPIEMVLRVAVLAMPFFFAIDLSGLGADSALVVAAVALALYYGAWFRYFVRGRKETLLFHSWLGLPVPLAVAPTVYLVAASVLTRSILMAVGAVVFGVVHISVSVAIARSMRHAA